MKKYSIMLLLLISAILVLGCGEKPRNNKKINQPEPGNSVTQEDTAVSKMTLIKNLQHDLFGQGNMQTIGLYVYEHTSASPLSWTITVDGQKILELGRDDYDMADMQLKDIDGDKLDEILVYRSSFGSAGAQTLNIYKPSAGKWNELFAVRNSFDLPSKRFQMKYVGNYQVRFEDPETGLRTMIPLVKERYKGMENSLPQIYSWVDPVSDYELKDIDGDRVMEITTMQRVCGISHADTIAQLKTVYKMQGQTYRANTISLHDDTGLLLAKVKLPALQSNNEIKIITDIKKYSLLMSSAQGIGLTPEFRTNQKSKVQYHWTTNNGNFLIYLNQKKDVVNSGKKLLWIPELVETSGKPDDIIIVLKAEDSATGEILAETSLTIETDGVFYIVQQ